MVVVRPYPLAAGEPIPRVSLALTPDAAVRVGLEAAYARAADSYVS